MAAICRGTIIKKGTPFISERPLRSLRNDYAVYGGIGTPLISEWLRRSAGICTVDRVKAAYGEKYDPMMMHDSKREVANLLHEDAETRSIRERLRQKQQAQQKQNKKKSRDSWER